MNEFVEACKAIYSLKPDLDYNYTQRKRFSCSHLPKVHQTHHKSSKPWVERHDPTSLGGFRFYKCENDIIFF